VLAIAGVSTAITASTLVAAPIGSASQDFESASVRSAAVASKCAKDHFCAFEDRQFKGKKLLSSAAGRGAQVDVEDKKTSSGINRTSNEWVGVNDRQFPMPDDDVFKFAPHSSYATISSDDTIDYFSVR
jgi:hypothetical protein